VGRLLPLLDITRGRLLLFQGDLARLLLRLGSLRLGLLFFRALGLGFGLLGLGASGLRLPLGLLDLHPLGIGLPLLRLLLRERLPLGVG